MFAVVPLLCLCSCVLLGTWSLTQVLDMYQVLVIATYTCCWQQQNNWMCTGAVIIICLNRTKILTFFFLIHSQNRIQSTEAFTQDVLNNSWAKCNWMKQSAGISEMFLLGGKQNNKDVCLAHVYRDFYLAVHWSSTFLINMYVSPGSKPTAFVLLLQQCSSNLATATKCNWLFTTIIILITDVMGSFCIPGSKS